MTDVNIFECLVGDSGGVISYIDDVFATPLMSGSLYFLRVNFTNLIATYGGALMALSCNSCNVTFEDCNFSSSGVLGLELGKGTVNDGGFFYIGGVSNFNVTGG